MAGFLSKKLKRRVLNGDHEGTPTFFFIDFVVQKGASITELGFQPTCAVNQLEGRLEKCGGHRCAYHPHPVMRSTSSGLLPSYDLDRGL